MPRKREPVVFAAVGDVHGSHHAMVRLLGEWEKRQRQSLSFVLQVGDFEPVRDALDLASMPVPEKYRKLGDFADFHEDRAEFPWPVWFVAGNHEPFAFLASMVRGGQAARNCYYLGRGGQRDIDGVRVAHLGGISPPDGPLDRAQGRVWKNHAYFTEREVERAMAGGRAEIVLLHEWPRGAASPGEVRGQRRAGGPQGPGNDSARLLVDLLEPRLVLAGHRHWPHRSRLSERTQFVGLAHIDKGPDAFAVFRRGENGEIVEVTG
ncbi:MAG: metallophosphoesterase [Deltaproteobacteria bacterium]|nr:metallophosphoesterase [Deltaproteobacteria bacterium]